MARDMTGADQGGNHPAIDERHPYGPRPISALLPKLVRPMFRGRVPATAQLIADWPEIVGPTLAAVTQPQRLMRSTLTLTCSGPIALELQHLSGTLIDRINTHLGRVAVMQLRFAQAPLPSPVDLPRRQRRAPTPEIRGISSDDLRDALAALGRAIAEDA